MRSHKAWRSWAAVALCSLAVGVASLAGCSSRRQAPTPGQRKLLGEIITAIEESTARLRSGKGTARVRVYGEAPKEKGVPAGTPRPWKPKYIGREESDETFLVDFWFKGQQSKSAFYEIAGGERGELTRVEIDGPDNWVTFLREREDETYESKVVIGNRRDAGFHRAPGQDFHPEAILNQPGFGRTVPIGPGIAFLHMMKVVRDKEDLEELTVHRQDNGLMAIKAIFGEDAGSVSFLVDPKADYLVLRYRLHGADLPARSGLKDWFDHYDAAWKRYGAVWYIERLTAEHERIVRKKEGKISLDRKLRIEVTAESFDPQAEIDDWEFTPGAIDIPDGTLILDRRIGVSFIPELDELEPGEEKIGEYVRNRQFPQAIEELGTKAKKVEEVCEEDVCRLVPTREALKAKKLLAFVHYLYGAVGSGGYNEQVKQARRYAVEVAARDAEVAKEDPLIHALSGGAEREKEAFREKYVGKKAPELSIQNWLNGEPLTLTELQGKVVLLEFWGLDCPACLTAVPALEEVHRRYADKGLVVIAVHAGTTDHKPVEEFVKEKQISFPVAIDTGEGWESDTFKAYEVNFIPQAWWIDKKGRVIRTGRDLQSDISVDDLLKQ